jgi:N-acetylglucosaminyl-diphospho-decaprenol L-rhamnosyltransferase
MSKLALITINHRHGEMIKKMVESLVALETERPFQLFVVNNLEDQGIQNWLREILPGVRVVENERPLGFSRNINRILTTNPDFDYYLLLNPDVICLPGMIDSLLSVMESDPQVGVAGPQLLDMDGAPQPSRRRFATFPVLMMRALHLDSLFKRLPSVDRYLMLGERFEDVTEVDWLTGAVMLLRKAALDEVGLFDERFFLYFEDEDLCCRMWRKRWKVCYIKEAKAFHAHMAAGRKQVFSKANFRHVASAFKMLAKYGGKIGPCRNHQP